MEADHINRMVGELRRFSACLLEPVGPGNSGLANASQSPTAGDTLGATAAAILHAAPSAFEECCRREIVSTRELVASHSPRGGAARILARDWQVRDGKLLPTRWQVPAFECEPDSQSLRWLLHAVECAGDHFRSRLTKLNTWVQDALGARASGQSIWARTAEDELLTLLEECEAMVALADSTAHKLGARAGMRLSPSARLPHPFPRSAIWGALRLHLDHLQNPQALIALLIAESLKDEVPACELPTLYQRWIGLQILHALARCGWSVSGDPSGALWLGGRIKATRQGATLSLEVETRYSRQDRHGALHCIRGESLTPDFTFLFQSPQGQQAWILDATLSSEEAVLTEKKAKYLHGLRQTTPRLAAGVPVFPRPGRVWLVTPRGNGTPKLYDDEGRTGHLSLHPGLSPCTGLDAWISDIAQDGRTRQA